MYKEIIDLSKPIVSFINRAENVSDKKRESIVSSLDKVSKLLDTCIEKNNGVDNKNIISYFLENGLSFDKIKPLIINILIDGYDPLVASVSYYFYLLCVDKKSILELSTEELFNEIIRLEPPFQYLARLATEDVYLGKYLIKKGERVVAFIGAVNRDPKIFDLPENILRRDKKNSSLSFGAGKHRCLGANLTKRIICHLINEINTRVGNEIELSEVIWSTSLGFRAIEKLCVEIK